MDYQEDLRKLTFELIIKSDPLNGIKDGKNVQVFKIYGEEDTVEKLKNRLSPRNWQSPTLYIGCNDRCDTTIRFLMMDPSEPSAWHIITDRVFNTVLPSIPNNRR